MLLVDVNVLLYAIDSSSAMHQPSRSWLTEALNQPGSVGFTWLVVVGFVRLATSARVWPNPLSTSDAVDEAERWITAPGSTLLEPTSRHLAVLRGLLDHAGAGANLTNDAHLAAIAIEHGIDVCNFDTDFDRFVGLRRVEPGAGEG